MSLCKASKAVVAVECFVCLRLAHLIEMITRAKLEATVTVKPALIELNRMDKSEGHPEVTPPSHLNLLSNYIRSMSQAHTAEREVVGVPDKT